MSSWFQSTGLDSAFSSLTESVQKATETVQNAIPAEHIDFLKKLTLNTDEMIHERLHFKEEALRKEEAKKRLGELLPWETKDTERDILVEECKDAILLLSHNEETFFGPYEMPLLNVQLEDDEDDDEGGEGGEEVDDEVIVNKDETEEEILEDKATIDVTTDGSGLETTTTKPEGVDEEEELPRKKPHYHLKPSDESKEKLSKLQPLPPLLEDFDLDSHVGLIQKLLKVDPTLVKMQATLSGTYCFY
jgi:hypothetical protein